MTWFQITLLSIVQGIAEFLPISSSGHLVVLESWLTMENEQDKIRLNVALHFGTLLSIVTFYWHRVWKLLFENRRVILLLIVGTLPVATIGVLIKVLFKEVLESALLAGCMLPLTGFVLLWSHRAQQGEEEYAEMSVGKALLIGTFQSIALLPGISRSGMTISAGLAAGQSKQSAATFSFLLAIPAILGATVLELKDIAVEGVDSEIVLKLSFGIVLSFLVGLGALTWLVRLLEKGQLHWFAYWCIPFGIGVIIWQLLS